MISMSLKTSSTEIRNWVGISSQLLLLKYLILSITLWYWSNVHEYLTKTTGLFVYWHNNGYTIILLFINWYYNVHLWQLFKMSTVTKNLLFGSLQNNFSNVQMYSKHLGQWLDTVGYPDLWAAAGIQTVYTCQLFLSQMHEIFSLSWLGFLEKSWRLPNISNNFQKTSEHCQKCPQMFLRRLSTSEAT